MTDHELSNREARADDESQAPGRAGLKPNDGYFHKFCINLPKEITNDRQLHDGQMLYLQHAGSACILRTEQTNEGDYEVKLTEYVTRRYNGNTYTVMKIALPKELALFNLGDLAYSLFKSELFRSCLEPYGTGC